MVSILMSAPYPYFLNKVYNHTSRKLILDGEKEHFKRERYTMVAFMLSTNSLTVSVS